MEATKADCATNTAAAHTVNPTPTLHLQPHYAAGLQRAATGGGNQEQAATGVEEAKPSMPLGVLGWQRPQDTAHTMTS